MSITYYNSKHDISYSKFNASNIPWNINTSYIYQNNLNTRNVSQYFQNINNNLLFESSTNNIIFITPQNKNVIVKNNMVIHNNLDLSKNLNTSLTRANDISVNNVLYFSPTTISTISYNVVGTLKVQGGIFINSTKQDKEASKTRFTGIVLYGTVIIFDCSIVDCDNIITTDISDSSIINSYIYNSPIGYDKYNNIYPNNAIFSDVILNNLIFDSSLNNNRLSFIRFNNNYNSNSITISSSNDFSNLEISKPLLVEQQETNTNIINVSNISIFNGDISCNTLYYSRLNPDIKLNTYFDVSVSAVSLSGSIIPTRSTIINLGSNTSKFRNIYSDKFTGVLDGSSTIALNLVPNLNMTFNNLNITGALTLNGLNLNQNLLTNFVTISNVNISFGAITSNISDLSINLNSRITILRNNITLSFGDVSSNIRTICGTLISISNDIFYTKTSFDTSLNRNFIKYTDLSTAIMENPNAIYGSIGYLDNALNKQISVTLSNELLFPYAITYIDDNVEDTNIRERYSYTMKTYKATTTVTSAYTIRYRRVWTSTPIYTTLDIQPDNASHLYVMMQAIRQTGDSRRRKWYDVDSNTRAKSVYRKITTAHTRTNQGPVITKYEVDTNTRTWQQHRDENTSTRTLAVISSSDEKGKVIDAINAYNSNVPYFIGATIINSYSTGGTIIADDDYIYHIFTSNGTFSPNFSGPIEALLVGGGGSGAKSPRFNGAGGGGGGGVIRIQERNVSPGDYDIVIGNGGRGTLNESGSDTTAFGATAAGGGRGRPDVGNGIDGGCGGGVSSANSSLSGGSGKSGNFTGYSDNIATSHGGNGGNYIHLAGITIDPICGSGGGGAGGNAPNITTSETGSGAGGVGLESNILGTTYYWGGGGGGAVATSGNGRFIGGYGGKGGGGGGVGARGLINADAGGAGGTNSYISNGGKGGNDYYGNGGNGAPNTGGGGGGCQQGGTPGNGGSGIVIIRYQSTLAQRRANWKWYDNTTWNTSITEWYDHRPKLGTSAVIYSNGKLYDHSATDSKLAIFKNTNYRETIETPVPANDELVTIHELYTWEQHKTYAMNLSNQNSNITYKLVSIHSSSANTTIANFAELEGCDDIFIGGKRKAGSNADGRSRNDWAWDDGSDWDHEEFFRGYSVTTYNSSYTQDTTPVGSSTTTNIPEKANTNTPPATFHTSTDISQTNVKLPLLVSSSNGSIIATATAIKVLDLPYLSDTTSDTRNVDGFTDIAGGSNTRTTRYFTDYARNIYNDVTNVIDYEIEERTLKYEYDTFSYVNSYNANNGLTTGSFKISDNSSNYSYYRTAAITPPAISTAYVCIAITNDGMFVALGKASNVTVYMKVSNEWISLGYIGVDFSTYTNSNMIPTQLPADFRKNIQNLAINYIAPTLFIAYGDNKTSIKVYRYTIDIAGKSWTLIGQPHTHNPITATAQLSNPTNFGYFVVLSSSPSILGFTVDDKFHTYNCSGASDNSIRGSSQTLTQPSTYNVNRNIIAFKISSDADKIIVSNTSYVFIYKWIANDWNIPTVIDYTSANITFDYGTTKNIRAWPRSLDISNISSNECVFAVGFPDKHIYSPTSTFSKPSTPSNARGYVEYWKLSNTTLTKLATLFPRMRDITTNTPGDIDEYFFSAGGIKITNSNTILVAPNYKFHFNSTNKSYYMSGITASHQGHENESIGSLAAIENEVENELIRFSARDFQGASYYIGGRRITPSNWYWWTRVSPSPFIWNFEAWDNNQPNVNDRAAVEVNTSTRRWNSVTNTDQKKAMYMTIMPSYSLNTFSIFNNKFFFHSSGFYSSYSTTTQSDTTTIIASWRISAGSESIRFLANGDVNQFNNTRTTMSDIRLKENIVDTRPKLQDLLKIRVVNYNLKGNKGNKLIGVVAQELEDIFPLLVGKQELSQEDIKLGKTETYKYVKYSCFDVMLIKAIQEQQAIISNLTSQLDLIDNKCKILKTIAQDVVILNQDRDFLICENELLKISINKILELMKKGTK